MPITEANGYLFLKKDNFKNDINLEIIVNILHDTLIVTVPTIGVSLIYCSYSSG